MIIVFEGLSCVGKTSLIKYLTYVTKCNMIEEWMNSLNYMKESIENKCILNDLYKTKLLGESEKLTLVDRYYPSTLACRFSETDSHINDFKLNISVNNYVEPTWWVYIKEDVEKSIERAKLNRKDDNSPWFNVEKAHRIVQFYDNFFRTKNNVIHLNSSHVHSFLMRGKY